MGRKLIPEGEATTLVPLQTGAGSQCQQENRSTRSFSPFLLSAASALPQVELGRVGLSRAKLHPRAGGLVTFVTCLGAPGTFVWLLRKGKLPGPDLDPPKG